MTDYLTGLFNMQYLKKEFSEYYASHPNAMVLSFDLNKFKEINDTFGHAEGDRMLKAFAEVLETVFQEDICIRRSGDEFLVLTSRRLSVIQMGIEDCIKLLKDKQDAGEIMCALTFSCGAAPMEEDMTISIDKADATMYEAKKNDKPLYFFRQRIYEMFKDDEKFLGMIDEQVQASELTYVTQKIFNAQGEFIGISELYSRDKFGNRILQPDTFRLLKNHHRVKEIDYLNLKNILSGSIPIETGRIVLNLHPQTFFSRDANFICDLDAMLKKTQVDVGKIILSINVKEYEDNIELLIEMLAKLKQRGFTLCLDSYDDEPKNASLSIYHTLDISAIKVSRNYWKKSMDNLKIERDLRSFVANTRDFGTTLVFASVDSDPEAEYVESMDYVYVKGYHYATSDLVHVKTKIRN